MKHTIIAIAMALSAGTVNAQKSAKQKTTFGIRAGINFQNINGKDAKGDKMHNSIIPGFNTGVNAEIPVATDFYIQPGLLFTTKGGKSDYKDNGQSYTQKVGLAYLEVPVNFLYKPEVGSGHLLAGFGPYVEFGLAGKVKYSGANPPPDKDVVFKNTITAAEANTNAYYRRVGAGANLLFGYELKNNLSMQLNAQLGLTNINAKDETVPDPKTAAKNTGFGISVGYRF